jgi:chemotaxis protein MotA
MRAFSAILGGLTAFLALYYVAMKTNISLKLYLDAPGLVLVMCGTLSAMLLSFSVTELKRVFFIFTQIFFRNERHLSSVALDIIKFCQESRISGFNEQKARAVHPFITDCLVLINDGYSSDDMREMLTMRIQTYQNKEFNDIGIIKSMVKYPPAFGMIGTVIGLIAMMVGMSSSAGMENVGPSMAIALTTTLYGLLISNFIFKPIADNLAGRSERNLTLRNMVMECMILANEKKSLIIIQDVANSFLTFDDNISIFEAENKRAA